MVGHIVTTVALTATIALTPPADKPKKAEWKSVGEYRITRYCCGCNSPTGYQSSSGKRLKTGYVACNDFPIGTKLKIGKKVYKVMDRCGVENTVDIFVDRHYCTCNTLDYREVKVKVK